MMSFSSPDVTLLADEKKVLEKLLVAMRKIAREKSVGRLQPDLSLVKRQQLRITQGEDYCSF